MYREVNRCRICGNDDLVPVLDLGNQSLSGIFPKSRSQEIESGPLELLKCAEGDHKNACGLLQLRHTYDFDELYGDNYGYRSGLNRSMVEHLNKKVSRITRLIKLLPGDLVIDIGSNDGTLLKAYPQGIPILAGIDPTGSKFSKYYPENIALFPDYFSSRLVKRNFGDKKAKVITSIAMFYDLESPVEFMKQIYDVLSDEGIWVFEQSYMPFMLKMNSYDTVCHEHLEYYRMKQIKWMTDKVGFKIIDVEFNNINGGSFSVTVAKASSSHKEAKGILRNILKEEEAAGLHTSRPYEDFRKKVFEHKEKLPAYIRKLAKSGKKIFGYGASTKGNVILQFCGLGEKDIPFIAEVNPDKFNAYTPGTLIPIISEEDAKAMKPDCLMVLPWHFKDNIVERERAYLENGGVLLFPLPCPETVSIKRKS